jgi:6-phosphogluconolactonase (cycloisomerase 2 family)
MKRAILWVALAALLPACGGGSSGGPAPAVSVVLKSQVVDGTGATVNVTDAASPAFGAQVVIPAGALAGATTITISQVTGGGIPADELRFEFGPDGTTFSQPVAVTVPYLDGYLANHAIADPTTLKVVSTSAGSVTETLGTTAQDTVNHLISAETTHFTGFAVRGFSDACLNGTYWIINSEHFGTTQVNNPGTGSPADWPLGFKTAVGTMTFDGNGALSYAFTRDEDGTVTSESGSATYSISSGGTLAFDVFSGGVLVGGEAFTVSSTTKQVMMVGIKKSGSFSTASLNGAYAVAGYHRTNVGGVTMPAPGGPMPNPNGFKSNAGTLTFDGAGGVSISGTQVLDGVVSPDTGADTYTVGADGALSLISSGFQGGVLAGKRVLLLGNTAGTRTEILVATAKGSGMSDATLSGEYTWTSLKHVGATQPATPSVGDPLPNPLGFKTQVGTAVFDGAGAFTASLTENLDGVVSAFSDSDTYSVAGDGTMTFGGNFAGGVLPGGNMAILATVSGGGCEFFVLLKGRRGHVTPPSSVHPRFAYVVNEADATLSSYTVDGATGQLRATGYVATGATPYVVALHPNGLFAYVSNRGANSVSMYSIDPLSGRLASLGAPVATGSEPYSVTIDPLGKFAYTSNVGGNSVSAFTIDPVTGALTSAGPAVAAGSGPTSVTVDPTGKFAYACNYFSNNVSAYTIDATTGVLTSVGPAVACGVSPFSVTVHPSGKFAYVANTSSADVSAYTIHATTGALTSVGPNAAAGTSPASVALDPSGRFAYVANVVTNDVSAYTINAVTGALTANGPNVAAGSSPSSVRVDPSGKFAYVANSASNNVSVYGINPTTGVLSALSTMCARYTSRNIAVSGGTAPVTYSTKFAYVTNVLSNDVSAYTVNAATGALTSAGPTVAAGTAPYGIAVDPTGKFAYAANTVSNNVSAYTINAASGALTSAGPAVAAGSGPFGIAVDPSGRFAYVANDGTDNVSGYTINPATGVLTSMGAPFAAGDYPTGIAIDPSGRFAFVANGNSQTVSAFTINSVTGALTSVGPGVAAGAFPYSVAVDPSGRFVYAANDTTGNVYAYTINGATGALTSVGPAVAAGTGTFSVAVDPSGKFAYAANPGSNDVSAYTLNAGSGALTSVGANVPAGTGSRTVIVGFAGGFAYVANGGSNDLSAYSIHPVTGALTSLGATVPAGTDPFRVTTTGTIQ